MKTTLVGVFLFAMLGLVQAQQSLPPLPAGRLPAQLDSAQWTVTISNNNNGSAASAAPANGGGAPPDSSRPTTVKVTKANGFRKIEAHMSDGRTLLCWCLGQLEYVRQDDGTWYELGSSGDQDYIPDYTNSDFPDCRNVISPQNYTSITTVSGSPCFVFSATVQTLSPFILEEMQMTSSNGSQNSADRSLAHSEVAVDMKTLLPLSVQEGSRTVTYQYLAPPGDLQPPPDLLMMIKAHMQRMSDLNRVPAHA